MPDDCGSIGNWFINFNLLSPDEVNILLVFGGLFICIICNLLFCSLLKDTFVGNLFS
jgi:hypothetical protein